MPDSESNLELSSAIDAAVTALHAIADLLADAQVAHTEDLAHLRDERHAQAGARVKAAKELADELAAIYTPNGLGSLERPARTPREPRQGPRQGPRPPGQHKAAPLAR